MHEVLVESSMPKKEEQAEKSCKHSIVLLGPGLDPFVVIDAQAFSFVDRRHAASVEADGMLLRRNRRRDRRNKRSDFTREPHRKHPQAAP